ncbi:S1 RNA-binding domain-containing protein [Streptomyces globisporus]
MPRTRVATTGRSRRPTSRQSPPSRRLRASTSWRSASHRSEASATAARAAGRRLRPDRPVPGPAGFHDEDRKYGFEGLVHAGELDESSGDVVEVGNTLTVKIIDVDLERRRIVLSQVQAPTPPADAWPGG